MHVSDFQSICDESTNNECEMEHKQELTGVKPRMPDAIKDEEYNMAR